MGPIPIPSPPIPEAEFEALVSRRTRAKRAACTARPRASGNGGSGGLPQERQVQRRRPGFPPIVLASDVADASVAVEALRLGAEDYLCKQTIDVQTVVETLRTAGEGAAPRPVLAARAGRTDNRKVIESLNAYRLVRKLGSGSQSRVYLAKRSSDATDVAIKIIASSALVGDDVVKRFEREAQALARISSRHVVQQFEHAFADDCGYPGRP